MARLFPPTESSRISLLLWKSICKKHYFETRENFSCAVWLSKCSKLPCLLVRSSASTIQRTATPWQPAPGRRLPAEPGSLAPVSAAEDRSSDAGVGWEGSASSILPPAGNPRGRKGTACKPRMPSVLSLPNAFLVSTPRPSHQSRDRRVQLPQNQNALRKSNEARPEVRLQRKLPNTSLLTFFLKKSIANGTHFSVKEMDRGHTEPVPVHPGRCHPFPPHRALGASRSPGASGSAARIDAAGPQGLPVTCASRPSLGLSTRDRQQPQRRLGIFRTGSHEVQTWSLCQSDVVSTSLQAPMTRARAPGAALHAQPGTQSPVTRASSQVCPPESPSPGLALAQLLALTAPSAQLRTCPRPRPASCPLQGQGCSPARHTSQDRQQEKMPVVSEKDSCRVEARPHPANLFASSGRFLPEKGGLCWLEFRRLWSCSDGPGQKHLPSSGNLKFQQTTVQLTTRQEEGRGSSPRLS